MIRCVICGKLKMSRRKFTKYCSNLCRTKARTKAYCTRSKSEEEYLKKNSEDNSVYCDMS